MSYVQKNKKRWVLEWMRNWIWGLFLFIVVYFILVLLTAVLLCSKREAPVIFREICCM